MLRSIPGHVFNELTVDGLVDKRECASFMIDGRQLLRVYWWKEGRRDWMMLDFPTAAAPP